MPMPKAKAKAAKVPPAFICPITKSIMKDPVKAEDGKNYERSAIIDWLQKHSTSPITHKPMLIADLVPNQRLKDAIDAYKGSEPSKKAPPAPSSPSAEKCGELGVQVRFSMESSEDLGIEGNVLISLCPPPGKQRTPVSIVCVIDVSGSMRCAANIHTTAGTTEGFGLTVLDVVKHAVKTTIASLNESDCLALVCFSDSAKVLLESSRMDAAGKERANSLVDELQPEGNTNLWGGLEAGLNVLWSLSQNKQTAGTWHRAICLFTDGEPNIVPNQGHMTMLNNYIYYYGLPGIINTFGFGYALDSQLLYDLAVVGKGAYAFIPDASFVGTIFVHMAANLLVTFATKVNVTIKPLNGAEFADISGLQDTQKVLGGYTAEISEKGIKLDAGPMRYDQSKELMFPMKNLPTDGSAHVEVTVKYKTFMDKAFQTITVEGFSPDDADISAPFNRLIFVDTVRGAMQAMHRDEPDTAMSLICELANAIKASDPTDAFTKALLEDIEGQVTLAFKPEFYQKWGKHYLPSLAFAHQHQFCNNFKDPGVQLYATGTLFQEIRDAIDDIFCSLPPPIPSYDPASGLPPPPVNMGTFHDSSNPCFSGNSLVLMADGSAKLVSQITRGDMVCTVLENGVSGAAIVDCVVVSPCVSGKVDMVEMPGGLCITPWHPIRLAGTWRFPADLHTAKCMPCTAVYNFVLSQGHILIVDDVECVTLGHGFQDDGVKHDFFGTSKVVNCLKNMSGWQDGRVVIGGVVRDPLSGLICGMYESA